jgi:hypothetical protein
MRVMTIPNQSWRRSLDCLSRAYVGAMVSVEVEHPDFGCHAEVRTQPLSGITADRSGITVHIAHGRTHVDRTIAHPSAVRFTESGEGALTGVEIDGRDGARTTVRFRSALHADLLDPAVE